MVLDIQHKCIDYRPSKINHRYSKNVHILSNPYLLSILAQFGNPLTKQPQLNRYIDIMYRALLSEVINISFLRESKKVDTRMKGVTQLGVFEGELIKYNQKAICIDLARAGTYPSHICFDMLSDLLNPDNVRQDHYYLNRKVNEKGEVIGVDVSGSKIGGGQNQAIVLLPDPMGATGGSISQVISHYKTKVKGKALKYVVMHLIVTPEYLKRMKKEHPDVEIFAIRLDRGLSSKDVLSSTPGKHKDKEFGLNEIQYVVPGVGGVGEILSNSFV